MMKDETKREELREVLEYYHTFVPETKDGTPDHKLCFGQFILWFADITAGYCS